MALSGPAVDARYFGEGGPVSTFRRFYGSGTASGDTRAPVRQSVCDGTGGLRSRFAAGERSGAVVHAKEGGVAGHGRRHCVAAQRVRAEAFRFGSCRSAGRFAGGESERL